MNAVETRREGHVAAWSSPWDGRLRAVPAEAFGSVADVLDWVCGAAESLGFAYCTIGMRFPLPLTRPRVVILGNHPERWARWYAEKTSDALGGSACEETATPPACAAGEASGRSAEAFWSGACSCGVQNSWTKSHRDGLGIVSRLTLGRVERPLKAAERDAKEAALRILSVRAHELLLRTVRSRLAHEMASALTEREIEILRWAADGKTGKDMSLILDISLATVRFHLKNAMRKLGAENVSAAIVRALMFDLLQGSEPAVLAEERGIPAR